MTTTSKALRKLARARMKQTGETYSTALAALRADAIKHARTFVCRWCKRAQVGTIVSTGVILGRRQCPSGPALANHNPREVRFHCQVVPEGSKP